MSASSSPATSTSVRPGAPADPTNKVNNWTVSKVDYDNGFIEATEPIPGSPRTITMTIRIEPQSPGTKTTVTVQVDGLLIATNVKESMCHVLASLVS